MDAEADLDPLQLAPSNQVAEDRGVIGHTIMSVGACSAATPFSMIERSPRTRPTSTINAEATRKKLEITSEMPATGGRFALRAAGAERPTPVMASAKGGQASGRKELFLGTVEAARGRHAGDELPPQFA